MHRIDNSSAATILPTPKQPGQPGFFTPGTIGGQTATIVEADWLNMVQEELLAVLAADALAPIKGANNQVITAILDLIRKNTRQRLTGAFDIYVATTGNDTNDGLTAATPFRTLQAAWNFIMERLDCGNNTIWIHIADGTYAPVSCTGMPMGGGSVVFQGNLSSPASCVIHSSTAGVSAMTIRGSIVYLAGMKFEASGDVYSGGILSSNASVAISGPCSFGACSGIQISATFGGIVVIDSNYTIEGGAYAHYTAATAGTIGQLPVPTAGSVNVNLVGTPNFVESFADGQTNGVIGFVPSNFHFIGTGATGKRYNGFSGGQIRVASGGANYFPGSIAGTVDAATFAAYAG